MKKSIKSTLDTLASNAQQTLRQKLTFVASSLRFIENKTTQSALRAGEKRVHDHNHKVYLRAQEGIPMGRVEGYQPFCLSIFFFLCKSYRLTTNSQILPHLFFTMFHKCSFVPS